VQVLAWLVFGLALAALGAAATRAGGARGGWLVPAAALLLLHRLSPRPHVAAWAALAFLLALCLRADDEDRHLGRRPEVSPRRLAPGTWLRAACLPVVALAGNLHSGAIFAAGVLGLFCLQAFWRSRRAVDLAIGALALAALCANPGGLFLLRSMAWHLTIQQVVVIGEHLPPTVSGEPAFFALLPAALWLAWRVRRGSRHGSR